MPSAEDLLNRFADEFTLDDETMDNTHIEFLSLVKAASDADQQQFPAAMTALLEHTKTHFADEEARMTEIGHGLLSEHRADHQRILGDMERLCLRANAGRPAMARAWVGESLLVWFSTHAKTMDSALAAELNSTATA
ncbi:hypothetical protein NBRC116494_22150 [Aurantivibrio plasticivorans]